MAKGPRYSVKFRRRREGKTNYHKRLALLKSNKLRLVIRKSNKHITCQIIEYKEKGDKVLLSVSSRDLKKQGWKYGTGNLPAAYLTGLLIGANAKKIKISEVTPDLGMYTLTKGSKIYTALKGAFDSELKFNMNKEIAPPDNRITGEHIEAHLKSAKGLIKNFGEVKKKILK